jgi:16S rRNA (cytidine1402-2'-O)-methyltransferase
MSGTLFVVATPIGNLEDITARALRVLKEVALIAAEDTRHTARLLGKYGIATPSTSLHEHNEKQKTKVIIDRLVAGDSVALVSDAGTPTVSDPGHRLIREARAANIRIVPIPGASAAIAALSVSGFAGEGFTFLGFPPTKPGERKRWFAHLSETTGIAVFFEAPHRIRYTLEEAARILGERHIMVGRELTKAHEELVEGPITDVLEKLKAPRGEFVVVVDCGHATNIRPSAVTDAAIIEEFRQAIRVEGRTRRQAAARTGRVLGLSTNEVYAAVERAGKSVE